ncbi:unnamed protein product, partial [marine sediment metagenome]
AEKQDNQYIYGHSYQNLNVKLMKSTLPNNKNHIFKNGAFYNGFAINIENNFIILKNILCTDIK